MHISLKALQYVVMAADCRSVTQAAQALNVSQPSVSTAIADLEAMLNITIFVRFHARGIALTAAGTEVVREARLLLKHADDFSRMAQGFGSELKGEIAVGCFETLAIRYMPSLIENFSKRYKGIKVSLHEGNQEEVLSLLLSGRTEISLSYHLALPDNVVSQTLAPLPPYAILAQSHPLAKRSRISLRELADEPFLLLDLPHSRNYFLGLFRSVDVAPKIAFRSRSQELIRGLAAHGHGFSIQNAIAGTDVTYDGSRVAAIRLEDDLPPMSIVRLHLQGHTLRPAVQAFDGFLRTAFGPSGLF